MKKSKCYENYPGWIMFLSNLFSITTYAIGAYILYQLELIWLIVYLFYIFFLEFKLMKKSCPNCYYYGKCCAFGKGKISAIFFKKGDAKKFCQRQITWKDILPDFMVSITPLIVGIVLLIINFNLLLLILLIILVLLCSIGSGFIRTNLACKYCKQRGLGCPAETLFNKTKK